jgi:hypothetical protein
MPIQRKEPIKSSIKISSVKVKLFLYVGVAMITSLTSDLSHHTDSTQGGFLGINQVTDVIIVLNFILQGLIAWRAFIDGSVLQEEQDLTKELEYSRTKRRTPRKTKTKSKN